MLDVYSRKVVGWTVEAEECARRAGALVEEAITEEEADPKQLALHADNGGAMKGSTMLATLQRLGVVASFSRPSVSDDNPFAEAIFRTLKYRPGYPRKPFKSLDVAREWVAGFVAYIAFAAVAAPRVGNSRVAHAMDIRPLKKAFAIVLYLLAAYFLIR